MRRAASHCELVGGKASGCSEITHTDHNVVLSDYDAQLSIVEKRLSAAEDHVMELWCKSMFRLVDLRRV